MELAGDKENVAPFTSSDPLQHQKALSPRKKLVSKKGRSKSIGPGDLTSSDGPTKADAKNRRKSTYVPATKSIIPTDVEKKERQAARRRTLANRRVSFAPEATLHTWDVIEFMRDHTTSTESSDTTRRASNITRSSSGESGSPAKHSPARSSDIEESSPASSEQEDDGDDISGPHRISRKRQVRRSSGIPPMNFNPDDTGSLSGSSGSSDASGSEEEEEQIMSDGESEDVTGTAMSLDMDEDTVQSAGSGSSTSSSARLDAALRQAAELAGTRGIEYDEHGDDVSMEMAGEEITNAFKPWSERVAHEPLGSASLDQENVNPFSPAFKAQIVVSVTAGKPQTIEEEATGDMSMDVTRAVGGIVKAQREHQASSPTEDATMEMTRAFGRVQDQSQGSPASRSGQKRRRSTTEAGSPGATIATTQSKRRRSSVVRSSMGDDSMDLTVAVGGIQGTASPAKSERRKSVARRRSSGLSSEKEDATMDMTQAFGGVKHVASNNHTQSSFDENEELTMELTTVLGSIRAEEKAVPDDRPKTPQTSQSPLRTAMNTTPKDQERFLDPPDSGPRKHLTPIFQKQVLLSAEKRNSSADKRISMSPTVKFASPKLDLEGEVASKKEKAPTPVGSPRPLPLKEVVTYPSLPSPGSGTSPVHLSPARITTTVRASTPQEQLQNQLDELLPQPQPSPLVEKQQRSTPAKVAQTPEKTGDLYDYRSVVDSIKLLSTPRKETLKAVTPKKHTPIKKQSPVKHSTPRTWTTPRSKATARKSPLKQITNDLLDLELNGMPAQKVHLQQFLDMAGIRFMDLTTTKRRLTTAPTPSKARRDTSEQEPEIALETAVVAAACTQPEHDMYQHACHELKHYISEGKKVIKQLEVETYREQPPLVRAYMHASGDRRTALDGHMREMKTQARYRSKEMWYAWRSQLLEDLMKALATIGEGLIIDDDTLRKAEETVERVLPSLLQQREELELDVGRLEQELASSATTEEEREDLATARERLVEVDLELEQKRRVLDELELQAQQLESAENDLQDNKQEFTAAIFEAERVREACRGISLDEIATLQDSIEHLEATTHWSIVSASSSPATITLSYRQQLQLFFHPTAFLSSPSVDNHRKEPSKDNSPISLTYIGSPSKNDPHHSLSTTLRFFLQLLRAALQALPQNSTRIPALLRLVSSSWDTALAVEESTRRLHLETPTTSRIVSDESLAVEAAVLLPKVRTKVMVRFEIVAAVNGCEIGSSSAGDDEEGGDGTMKLSMSVEPSAKVAYGEAYGEDKMTRFVRERIEGSNGGRRGGVGGWEKAVRELREKLVAQGGSKEGLKR